MPPPHRQEQGSLRLATGLILRRIPPFKEQIPRTGLQTKGTLFFREECRHRLRPVESAISPSPSPRSARWETFRSLNEVSFPPWARFRGPRLRPQHVPPPPHLPNTSGRLRGGLATPPTPPSSAANHHSFPFPWTTPFRPESTHLRATPFPPSDRYAFLPLVAPRDDARPPFFRPQLHRAAFSGPTQTRFSTGSRSATFSFAFGRMKPFLPPVRNGFLPFKGPLLFDPADLVLFPRRRRGAKGFSQGQRLSFLSLSRELSGPNLYSFLRATADLAQVFFLRPRSVACAG